MTMNIYLSDAAEHSVLDLQPVCGCCFAQDPGLDLC